MLAKNDVSWINFKIDRKLHAKFSFLLQLKRQPLKDVACKLIENYVRENEEHFLEAVSSKESNFFEDCDACQ